MALFGSRRRRWLSLAVLALCAVLSGCAQREPIISNWPGNGPSGNQQPGLVGQANANQGLVGRPAPQARLLIDDRFAGDALLAAYTAASQPLGEAAGGQIRHYRRDLGGEAQLFYTVVELTAQVELRVLTADGATLTSDANGDTMWADGQAHLATVHEMVNAPYALRDGRAPIAAMALGYHGARTADEGTVVIDGEIQHLNPWRAAFCLGHDAIPTIGIYDRRGLADCAQAAGAGPVLVWRGKIASPEVQAETETLLPFNPLGEDFQQLDYRIENFYARRPKTALGLGLRSDGQFYLVLANSHGATGLELAEALRALGCVDVLGGDDGLSTQMTWLGQPVHGHIGREVPTAFAVYLR